MFIFWHHVWINDKWNALFFLCFTNILLLKKIHNDQYFLNDPNYLVQFCRLAKSISHPLAQGVSNAGDPSHFVPLLLPDIFYMLPMYHRLVGCAPTWGASALGHGSATFQGHTKTPRSLSCKQLIMFLGCCFFLIRPPLADWFASLSSCRLAARLPPLSAPRVRLQLVHCSNQLLVMNIVFFFITHPQGSFPRPVQRCATDSSLLWGAWPHHMRTLGPYVPCSGPYSDLYSIYI